MAKKKDVVMTDKPEFGIPVFWGKRGSGKTLISLNSPYQPVHIIDVENSSADYEQHMKRLIELGYFKNEFTRTFTPQWIDFLNEINRIVSLPDYTYGTVAIDTVGQVSEWVKTDEFSKAGAMADKMAQVIWGRVRDRLRNMLLVLSKKTNLIILLAHEREYNKIYSPRCNPAVLELSSVSMRLVREPNKQIPDGLLSYARLPFWPPRIPDITIAKMLEYIQRPADWNDLPEEEKQAEEESFTSYVPEGDDE